MRTIYMNVLSNEKRIAVVEDKKIMETFIHRPNQEQKIGNIYLGRVVKVLPGMQAAFVDIGGERNAYLHRDDIVAFQVLPDIKKEYASITSLVHQGQQLLLQVVKEQMEAKGPKVKETIEFTGKYVVYMPYDQTTAVSRKITNEERREELLKIGAAYEGGYIFRSASEKAARHSIVSEIEHLQAQFYNIKKKQETMKSPALVCESHSWLDRLLKQLPEDTIEHIVADDMIVIKELRERIQEDKVSFYPRKENIFSYFGVEQELEKALKKVVWLENGAYLLIEQTETMTVIDVNTGKFTGKQNLQDTVVKTNKIAALEIARQLRLRDIGGMILIDFINMHDERSREMIRSLLINALKHDSAAVRILQFTSLGILEMTRRRKQLSLQEQLMEQCTECGGNGRVLSVETIAYRLERELWELKGMEHEAVWIEATGEVLKIFTGKEGEHQKRMEQALGFMIYVTEDASLNGYQIRQLGTKNEIKNKINRDPAES
ncbi:Rne/Rng family ribonuclease [Bacillus sp. 165]|uniref:Rne/Rng family ribonuclease n=1 Tax=Bacillus sp. 165 TaxID=1529117 RepID=UPI001ADAF82E|nr:Rne/Rng family ribonuclease [Bacillus sp. 165]MBO9130500.1 Rne/Rng family ribonuclease [Bacillus sp. 165]